MAGRQRIGLVGGTGYAGAELLRLLAAHDDAEIVVVTSRSAAGTPTTQAYPQLRGMLDLTFTTLEAGGLDECDVVFFATPHAAAMHDVPRLLKAGVRVIDLSADFRLSDPELWARWYNTEHAAPDLIGHAVYGLPELGRRESIAGADLVAVPGCYPTAVLLGFKPLIDAGIVAPDRLIADAKTGVSGAGMKVAPGFLFAEAADSFKAYGVAGHRHLPEIRQFLGELAGREVGLTFVPHLVPMVRGIHATLYATLTGEAELQSLYERTYADEPFVDVLGPGSAPETRHVRATNMCRIAVHQPSDGDQAVVLSTIDNLVKGAAGQAVQCFNLMIGAPETRGLTATAPVP